MNMPRRLPPGQRAAELDRFGLPQFARRHVTPPARPTLNISGEVRYPSQFDVGELIDGLVRHEQSSDLHCVTTWSALDLTWSGIRFGEVVQRVSEIVHPHPQAQWLVTTGLDGYRSCLAISDALADDVLLADHLQGMPLTANHGAPLRLLAPQHYGYKSVKHLACMEFSCSYVPGSAGFKEHPRGRVGPEERSRWLPGPAWRRIWAAALPAARRMYQARS